MPVCAPTNRIHRDADGKLLRNAAGQLLTDVLCEGTLRVVVSGFTGACADMNGEYILPLNSPAACEFSTQASGGSVPPTWGGYMLVYWYTTVRPHQWRMRISPAGGGNQATSYIGAGVKNPNNACPIGSWTLLGRDIFPYNCTGQLAPATSEWVV